MYCVMSYKHLYSVEWRVSSTVSLQSNTAMVYCINLTIQCNEHDQMDDIS